MESEADPVASAAAVGAAEEGAPLPRRFASALGRVARSRPFAPLRWCYGRARHLTQRVLLAAGVDFYIRTDDRRILETIILPYFARGAEWRRILFVGCAWYTRGYRRLFAGKDYRTIEIDRREARYGAAAHIVDSVENIGAHFPKGELDVIICNGVFGWGLDERAAVERAFRGCFDSLRDGGVFVLGWNDLPDHRPFPLESSEALRAFRPFVFPPLGGARVMAATGRHTYDFYRKPFSDHAPIGREIA